MLILWYCLALDWRYTEALVLAELESSRVGFQICGR